MQSRLLTGTGASSADGPGFSASEFIVADGNEVRDFALTETFDSETEGQLGPGVRHVLVGQSDGRIEKRVEVTAYEKFPDMLTMRVEYKNNSGEPISISKWVNSAHTLAPAGGEPAFWSFQGASYEDRRDWVMPLSVGFSQDNYLGMNASDYGSGTPVSDVWRRDIGVAVGHLETVPKLVSLPVRYLEPGRGAELSVEYEYDFEVAPGESISTFETFIHAHAGDYYAALKNYRHAMAMKGLEDRRSAGFRVRGKLVCLGIRAKLHGSLK